MAHNGTVELLLCVNMGRGREHRTIHQLAAPHRPHLIADGCCCMSQAWQPLLAPFGLRQTTVKQFSRHPVQLAFGQATWSKARRQYPWMPLRTRATLLSGWRGLRPCICIRFHRKMRIGKQGAASITAELQTSGRSRLRGAKPNLRSHVISRLTSGLGLGNLIRTARLTCRALHARSKRFAFKSIPCHPRLRRLQLQAKSTAKQTVRDSAAAYAAIPAVEGSLIPSFDFSFLARTPWQ